VYLYPDSKNWEKMPLPLGWRGKQNTPWIQNCTHSHYFSTIQTNRLLNIYSAHHQVRIEIVHNLSPIYEANQSVDADILQEEIPTVPAIRLEGDVVVPIFTRHRQAP